MRSRSLKHWLWSEELLEEPRFTQPKEHNHSHLSLATVGNYERHPVGKHVDELEQETKMMLVKGFART